MNDMASAIVPKSDQLNADDLIAGPITITISRVVIKSGEQPVSIFYEGDNGKPYKCCKSMARILVSAWGADASKYVGRSLTLYRDPLVKWAGMDVGGIRISHMSDIATPMTMALTVTRANKKPFTVRPLDASAAKTATPKVTGLEPSSAGESGANPRPSNAQPSEVAATDADLLKEVGRRCDEGKFDLAFDLARGITDEKKLAKVNARIKSLQDAAQQ